MKKEKTLSKLSNTYLLIDYRMKQKYKARFIREGDKLSKKGWDWKVPGDLRKLAKKYNKVFIGVGYWRNIPKKYVCIARPRKKLIYIEGDVLEMINRFYLEEK